MSTVCGALRPIVKERKRGVDSNLDITGSCATGWRGEGGGYRAPVIEGVPIADSDAGHSCEGTFLI